MSRHSVEKLAQSRPELVGNVLENPARPVVANRDSSPAHKLEEVEDVLPLPKHVHERSRQRAKVLQQEPHCHQVAGYSLQLGGDHPEIHAARHRLDAGQLLDGQDVRLVVGHRRYVVHPVRQRDDLGEGPLLGELLAAPVEVADDHFCIGHRLAVERDAHPQHTVG